MRLKKLTPEQALESVELYKSGMGLRLLGRRYNVTANSMKDLLIRRIGKLRPNRVYGPENHFWRGGSREDDNAQGIVERALLSGKLVRPDQCSSCGKSKVFKDGRSGIQAHHPDYNKPLEVTWLCQPCHHLWHKHNKAIMRGDQ